MRRWLVGGAAVGALLGRPAAAQQGPPAADSAAVAAAVAAAGRTYRAALHTGAVLYDGPEYVDYTTPGTRGHQFFGGPAPQAGTVQYRGGAFDNVLMRYDLLRDQPVLLYPGEGATVALVAGKVAGFTLGPHRFVRVAGGDSLAAGALPAGFYELLVDGPVRLLARHRKQVQRVTISQNLAQEYQQTDQLFGRSATAAAELTSLKKLLALLPTHQAEVQRYARQQGLKFSSAERVASAERALRYYYSLRP
ncbi:hypothetical protein [Hymenobacter nivis]|uniref:Uncharacterized protein n=1 Tax=Hymenobacter nivis TaxID=1850093 RepID=A0A502GN15_9BACT|nr:hypothetical protein [Hymenobacter nivis]TPG63539.1 hypothetical protein EAH73_15875 [Hymenobacter nivis]